MDVDVSEQTNPTSLLDFLNIHLPQQQSNDTNEHNGHARPDASDQENNDTYEENTQQLSVGEVLERELAALLTQSTNNINTGASSDLETAGPSTLPTNTTSSINTSGDAPATQEDLVEQPHVHEHYLSGLAAVLQAAQAMQARNVVKNVPAFHSLNAESDSTQVDERGDARADVSENAGEGQMGEGLSNDFSDLLAHLTAQLEQAGEQNAPVEDPVHSSMASGGTEDASESYNFFAPTPSSIIQAGSYHTSATHSMPVPSSGTIPYYSGVFGTSGPKSSAAGPSIQKNQDHATDGNEKTKRKRRRKAGEKKSFPCEYGCDKTFGRKSDALRHARIHTGDRPFLCPYTECGKAFIQRSALHVHLRVHSGDKPHMCEYPLCGRTFSDSSSLARHRRTHTGRRPYACERPDCAKTFTRRTTLTAHMRTHDPTWEPDPRKRYSFKPKRRKREGGDEEEDEEEEGGEEDAATLETLSSLLSQAGPGGALPPLGVNLELNGGGGRTGSMNTNAPLEARVAAISAEIAAAIAQAQIQAQLDDDDDEDEEGESDEEEQEEQDNGNMRGIAHGMNVSGIRTEQPEPRPENVVPPSPVTASVAAPAPPLAESHGSSAVVGDEEEDDFPVPLRERKSKPIDVVSAGSKRKR